MLKVNFYDCPVKTILMSYLSQLNKTVGGGGRNNTDDDGDKDDNDNNNNTVHVTITIIMWKTEVTTITLGIVHKKVNNKSCLTAQVKL
jgi:hypothetical protein